MDKATKVLVWIALGVAIAAGGIYISNDQAAKQAAKRAIRREKLDKCWDNILLVGRGVCFIEGVDSKQCETAMSRCADNMD